MNTKKELLENKLRKMIREELSTEYPGTARKIEQIRKELSDLEVMLNSGKPKKHSDLIFDNLNKAYQLILNCF